MARVLLCSMAALEVVDFQRAAFSWEEYLCLGAASAQRALLQIAVLWL